jgi:hypothetical protein
MERPGSRYRALANRCRQSAEAAEGDDRVALLLQMARGYERRAQDLEVEWALRSAAARVTPLSPA